MIPVEADARVLDAPAAGVCPAIHVRLAHRRAAADAVARLLARWSRWLRDEVLRWSRPRPPA